MHAGPYASYPSGRQTVSTVCSSSTTTGPALKQSLLHFPYQDMKLNSS